MSESTPPPADGPVEELIEAAVPALERAAERLEGWFARVRGEAPGRFRWAEVSTRPANVIATGNILNALHHMGWMEKVIGEEDRRGGIEWVRAMHLGNQQYRDPALAERPAPEWPQDEPWPSPGMRNLMSGRAHTVLMRYGGFPGQTPPRVPPPEWPQADDNPESMLEWMRTRPWETNPWGAGSHAMRMARWMLQWHKEGRMSLGPAIDAVRLLYSFQDPETGLWGGQDCPRQVRINGAFKVFVYTRAQLDLPVPHADRLLDQIVEEMTRPGYAESAGGCDEWDNWYVIRTVMPCAPDHRTEDLHRLAAWSIHRILDRYQMDDGGLSYHPGRCATQTCGYDMAPSLPQGDSAALPTLAPSVNACVDMLGLTERVPWCGWSPDLSNLEPEDVRRRFREGLGLENAGEPAP